MVFMIAIINPPHQFPSQLLTLVGVPAWASGFEQDTSVFSMLGVTGSNPQFRKPENFRRGRLQVFSPN